MKNLAIMTPERGGFFLLAPEARRTYPLFYRVALAHHFNVSLRHARRYPWSKVRRQDPHGMGDGRHCQRIFCSLIPSQLEVLRTIDTKA
jgi:hypothetical protein